MRVLALVVIAACGDNQRAEVFVPASSFTMGCSEADTRCEADELPAHTVALRAFYLDRDEVDQAHYDGCVQDGDCELPSGMYDPSGTAELPVVFVDWDRAAAYCAWSGQRLPTEAEWEHAARGYGANIYPWGSVEPTCERANVFGCGDALQPVGGHPLGESPFGARDMAGNVMEWVADWYDAQYYATSPAENPAGPDAGTERVKRGGSYMGDADTVRVSNRVIGFPVGLPNLGFRCARDAE